MTDLGDYGGGIPPEKQDDDQYAHPTRTSRAKQRRRTYRMGRCRGISTARACRCAGAVTDTVDGPFCHYHGQSIEHPTIDDAPDLVARWCGTRPTTWDEIPEPCRAALMEVAND